MGGGGASAGLGLGGLEPKGLGRRGGLAIFGLAEIKRRYSFLNP
jgi:hypothetical protein